MFYFHIQFHFHFYGFHLKEPKHAAMLVRKLVKNINKPVSIKFRLGWDHDTINFLDFGKRLEEAGASMVSLHARTRAQGYAPGCKWEAFGELKQALSIPVIANGDIHSMEDAHDVIETYGVDGVMVGRATQGKPWFCGDVDHFLKTGKKPTTLILPERLTIATEHAEMLCDYRGEQTGMREMRKHLAWYVEGFRHARLYRTQLMQVETLEQLEIIFQQIRREQSEQYALVG